MKSIKLETNKPTTSMTATYAILYTGKTYCLQETTTKNTIRGGFDTEGDAQAYADRMGLIVRK